MSYKKMENSYKPNVLVAGFPKCGSTYLYHLLKQHPDIFIPEIKEINYFNKDHFFLSEPEILNPRYFKPLKWYYVFFKSNKKIKIDFSIISALDIASARRARKTLGDIKIIFITRNKKDFLNSIKNFLEKEGAKNKNYEEYSDFDYYMDNYKRQFSNVLVISIEKLDKSPKRELRKISDFLGIRPWNFNLNVPRHETKDYKFGLLHYIKRYTYFFIVRAFYKFAAFTVKARIKAQGEK
jgi:hypothetical protein